MTQRICSIADCDSTVLARGWCSRHYGSWQRLGDPSAARRWTKRSNECSVEGCDVNPKETSGARGMCGRHYKLWLSHGTATPRLRAQVVEGKKICARCKADVPVEEFDVRRVYCKPCASAKTRRYYVTKTTFPVACFNCGETFAATKRQNIFCSDECRAAGINRRNWKHVQARRARESAATVETFHSREIFARDGWVCQLCGDPIDRSARAPEPLSASIDHIIPISRGGEHSRANTQAAHLGCNVHKGSRILI